MGSFSITHWLILLGIVIVVFGTARLKNAGKDLGSAVKGFKDAMQEGESKKNLESAEALEDEAKQKPH